MASRFPVSCRNMKSSAGRGCRRKSLVNSGILGPSSRSQLRGERSERLAGTRCRSGAGRPERLEQLGQGPLRPEHTVKSLLKPDPRIVKTPGDLRQQAFNGAYGAFIVTDTHSCNGDPDLEVQQGKNASEAAKKVMHPVWLTLCHICKALVKLG